MPPSRVPRRSRTPDAAPRRQWRQPPTRIYAPGTKEWAEREAQTRRAETATHASRTPSSLSPELRLSPEPRQWHQPPTRIWAPGERERLQRDAQLEREREEVARRQQQQQSQNSNATNKARPLNETDKDLFCQLLGCKPVFLDSHVRQYWGHMTAVWEQAVLGYRWNWRPGPGIAPYKVPVTPEYVRVLVQQLQWISRTRMQHLV